MNWGKGIAIALTLFIGFIVYLVVVLVSHKVDLESDDYYQREIAYENEIQAMNNAAKLKDAIKLDEDESNIIIQIPSEASFENVKVYFSRPNDINLDKEFKVEGTKTFLIPKEELKAGQYNVSISYTQDKENYLQKNKIFI